MRRKKRSLPGEFKAKVALAALRGDKTLNQVAAQYDVHNNQVSIWKKQLLEAAKDFFSDRREHPKGRGRIGGRTLSADRSTQGGVGLVEKKSRRFRVRPSGC